MSEDNPPLTNGSNGERDPLGRFKTGNRGGPGGSDYAARVLELKKRLVAAITDHDWDEIVKSLIRQAKGGDLIAAKLLFDRTLGKVPVQVEIGQIEPPNPDAAIAAIRDLLGIKVPIPAGLKAP